MFPFGRCSKNKMLVWFICVVFCFQHSSPFSFGVQKWFELWFARALSFLEKVFFMFFSF